MKLFAEAEVNGFAGSRGGHRCRTGWWLVLLAAGWAFGGTPALLGAERWVGTWVSMPQLTEPHNMPPAPGLAGNTLRQIVQPSLGGAKLRVTFSNAFGNGPVTIASAHIARSAGESAIEPASDRELRFNGAPGVTIQPGALMISDPVAFGVEAFANLAVTVQFGEVPSGVTGHPGSRTTSFIQPGAAVDAASLPEAAKTDHWYYLSGIDVTADAPAAAIVVVGDSITDGRGSTTNKNDRWPNQLSRRLAANPATAHIAVLNQGAGGNRVLRDGLGPNALARFDRDVIAQAGVKWVIVFEGVNDIGTAVGARAKGQPAATADDLIGAFRQMITRAHTHGLRIYGATITGFEGFKMYSTPGSEADRQKVNDWIRHSGEFDGVIDFDAATRDPDHPARLSAAVDGGDHLHPSAGGSQIMADAVDLKLFEDAAAK
jgi:lysophospholipase L1-like esterase